MRGIPMQRRGYGQGHGLPYRTFGKHGRQSRVPLVELAIFLLRKPVDKLGEGGHKCRRKRKRMHARTWTRTHMDTHGGVSKTCHEHPSRSYTVIHVCVCVCVREREREGERARAREIEREHSLGPTSLLFCG